MDFYRKSPRHVSMEEEEENLQLKFHSSSYDHQIFTDFVSYMYVCWGVLY